MFSIPIRRKEYYRIPISILIILTFSQLAFAQSTNRLSLSDAVKIALKNNREIAILQKDIEKAKGEKQAAFRILQDNPEIAGEVKNRRSGNQNFTDFGFSLSQPIEIGRQRHYRIGMAELNLLKTQLQLERERLAVTEKIKMLFIDLTALNEKFQAVQNILEVEQDLLQWISIRAAHGEISSVALQTVKLEFLETKEKLLDIQRAIIAKKRELQWVMNAPIPEDIEIVYSWPEFLTKIELDKLQKYAEKHNPDIKISLADLKKAEASVKLTKAGQIIPYIKLSLNYSREENDNLIGPGLSIPLPLFNRKTGEVNAARKGQEKAALDRQRIREKILSEINKYYETLTIIERQRKLFVEEILPITQQDFNEIKARYQTGEIDLMTLERFWDNWMEVKINYTDLLQEYYYTLCQIELLVGIELKEVIKKHPLEEQKMKNSWREGVLKYGVLLVFFLSWGMITLSCSRKKENRPLRVSNLVQTVRITRKNFNRTLTTYGYVRSLKETDIVAYTRGRITNIWVRDGEKVEKGQRLLSLEGYYSIRAFEESESSYKKELGKDIIKIAPVSGYVTQITKSIGSTVEEGEVLVSIVDLKNLLAEVTVFGTKADSIKPGQSAVIMADKERLSGKVSFISTEINRETGARKIGIDISQKKTVKLLPGDFVKADIIVEKHLSSLAIPEEALLNDGGQNVVMVKVGQTYEKRDIVIGLHDQGYVEVLKGLSEGEEVVTVGAYELLNRGIEKKIKVED